MPTIQQLIRSKRKVKIQRRKTPALKGCPQRKGVCMRTYCSTPKKPNSALRKVARVKLSSRVEITAAIPGISHFVTEHCIIIVRGGRVKDLPGCRYRVVRGVLDAVPVKNRRRARSKYGKRRPFV